MILKCCEHNPCPLLIGPKRFLGRFRVRPWACPQCGKLWKTKATYCWMDFDGWEWELVIDPKMVENWVMHS